MKKIILQLIFSLLTILSCFAQRQNNIDSLKSVLKNAKADSSKVTTFIRLSDAYYDNLDSGIYYANQALLLANILKNNLALADAHVAIAKRFSWSGKQDSAIVILKNAMNIYNQIPNLQDPEKILKIHKRKANNLKLLADSYMNIDKGIALKFYTQALQVNIKVKDTLGIAKSYEDIAFINFYSGRNSEALKYYFIALNFFELLKNKEGIADTYTGIARFYVGLPDYRNALKYYFASLKVEKELNRSWNIGYVQCDIAIIYQIQNDVNRALLYYNYALINFSKISSESDICSVYTSIGELYASKNKYAQALKYYLKSANILNSLNNVEYNLIELHLRLGETYFSLNNFEKAIENYFICSGLANEMQDKIGSFECLKSIGYIYFKQGKFQKADNFLKKALLVAKELNSYSELKTSYWHIYKLDSAQGNIGKSLEHYKLYILYRDSITNQENTKKIVQTQMQYDFDKKEAATKAEQDKKDAIAVKELQKQKLVRNGFVGGFAVMLLFAGVFFTQRNKIKKGKRLSDELLLNILPSEVAEELKAKGSADAKQFDEVTVMFTDFKGFTQISEKLTPAELVAEIHTCFKAFDDIITKHNIEKIKTIGDAYMCAGGLPMSNTTHASDVVQAAIEIQHFMLNHLQERKASGKELFEIRIGIHTGPVVAGIVGVKKFAYDIWGDTVNIASRMESSGEAGKVNISGSTYELVKDKFSCIHRGKIQAKNKGEIDMYFVEAS